MLPALAAAALVATAARSGAAAKASDIPVADLLQVTDISNLSASPDGRSVVFRVERADIASNGYPSLWYGWIGNEGLRTLGSGGEALFVDPGVAAHEPPIWAPDSSAIFYRALSGGKVELWRARLDGSGSAVVLADDADILSVAPTPDAKGAIVTTGPTREAIRRAEDDEYDAGILVDQHVDLGQSLFRGAMINGHRATQRITGGWFTRGGLLWSSPTRAQRLDLDTLKVEEADAAGAGAPSPLGPPREARAQSRQGDVATASPEGSTKGIEVRRKGGGASLLCRDAPCTGRVSWLAWGRTPDEMVFAIRDTAHAQSLFLWDLAKGRVRPLASSSGLLSGGREPWLPCAVADGALFCVAAEAASPPRLEKIELASGARTVVFDPNAELRNRLKLHVEPLRWRGAEGHEFAGILFSGAGTRSGPRPLFVDYYMCEGFLRGGVGDEWPLASLAAAGIDALCVNSAILGGPQDSLATYRAAAEGIEAIVAKLAREGRTDAGRVGMGGLSFGSEVTLWVAYNSRLLAAASIASPGLEPGYYWMNGVRGRQNHEILASAWKLRSPEETPERWKTLSAALNADRIMAPLLMQLPEQETRVVTELYARLSNGPAPVELYAFPDEPHIKVLPRHKLAAYQRNLDWFRYWLLGEKDPDPLRNAQYRRWDALRARATSLSSSPPKSAATAPASPGRKF